MTDDIEVLVDDVTSARVCQCESCANILNTLAKCRKIDPEFLKEAQ